MLAAAAREAFLHRLHLVIFISVAVSATGTVLVFFTLRSMHRGPEQDEKSSSMSRDLS